MNYGERLTALFNEIKQHPALSILEEAVSAAATETAFLQFETTYGIQLPTPLKELYTFANGLKFSYALKDESDAAIEQFNQSNPYPLEEAGPPYKIGALNLLPFHEVFLEDTWEGTLYQTGNLSDEDETAFGGKAYTYNSLGALIKPFDLYADDTVAAFLLIPEYRFNVLLLQDHYADWNNSRIISFEDYFELLLKTKTSIAARELVLSETDGDAEGLFKVDFFTIREPISFG